LSTELSTTVDILPNKNPVSSINALVRGISPTREASTGILWLTLRLKVVDRGRHIVIRTEKPVDKTIAT
jgi:hypothetical protein